MKLTFGRQSRVAQPVTCLIEDPGVARVQSRPGPTLSWRLDHDIISTAILLHSADSRRIVVKRNSVHEILVNRLVNPAPEKVWLGDPTVP